MRAWALAVGVSGGMALVSDDLALLGADARRLLDEVVALGREADAGPHPHEANLLRLDSSKAHARLGWRPRLSVGDAVEWSVSWYAAAAQGADMRKLTLDQIARYGAEPTIP